MWTVHLNTPIRTTPSSVCPCCAIVPSFRCLGQSFRTSENASSKHNFSSRACAICISRCRLFHMSVVWYRDMWPTNLAPGPPLDWLKASIKGFCSQCVCRQVIRATWQRVTRDLYHHLPPEMARQTAPPSPRSDHPFKNNYKFICFTTFHSTDFWRRFVVATIFHGRSLRIASPVYLYVYEFVPNYLI